MSEYQAALDEDGYVTIVTSPRRTLTVRRARGCLWAWTVERGIAQPPQRFAASTPVAEIAESYGVTAR